MTRHVTTILVLITFSFCKAKGQNKSKSISSNKKHNNIRFDFAAKRIDTFGATIEVNASLYNTSSDTVYFLTSSCDGSQYSLQYDKSKLLLTPFIHCNASFPRIERIAPKRQYNFKANFRDNKKDTKIKLGFDFHQVDRSFNLNTIKTYQIHYRPKTRQNILWAEEKSVNDNDP
jgi:hypothetical protein